MKTLLFNYCCAKCNAITKAPGLPDMAYGEFIMFNSSGDSVYLNAIKDVAFNEIIEIFKQISKKYNEINEGNASDILQSAYSIACDYSSDGSRYSIAELPTCISCGSKKMASWGPTNPIEYTNDLASPTHEEWNKLSEAEKRIRIKEAIEKELGNKDNL